MATRDTRQRCMVLEAVRSRTDHPSADDIYLAVRERDPRISRGTVYRNLNVLAESGEITHVKVPSADRYDLRQERHYHLFCVGCGAVCDAPLDYREQLDRQVEAGTGFAVQRHRMIFEGLCPACQEKRKSSGDERPEENTIEKEIRS